MHILVLSHYYPPEVNAPASRIAELARAWTRMGHRVSVVTAAPNHPSGKLFPGYRNRWFARETMEGVEVIRIWTYLAANEGFARRLLSYLSYPFSLLLNLWRLPTADIVISTSPQFFCGLSGLLVQRRRRPWILEIRDLWPESIVAVGAMKRGLVVRLLERLESFAYRRADLIVSVTDSFVSHIERIAADATPVAVIKNGVDFSLFDRTSGAETSDALAEEFDLAGKFVAAYVGTHGMAHGLDTILHAAELLKDSPHILFLMAGDGAERGRLEQSRQERDLWNVRLIGQRPRSDMPALWQLTDVSLVLLRKLDTFRSVLPSKMFEAMAMARPIILGVEGEARTLLRDAEAGIAIEPENASELAAAVRTLAADAAACQRYGDAGRAHVEQYFDRNKLAGDYFDLMVTLKSE